MFQMGLKALLRYKRTPCLLRSYHKKQRIGNPVTILNQTEHDAKLEKESDYGFVPYLNNFKQISNSTNFETRHTDIDELHPSSSENKVSKADWIKDKHQSEKRSSIQSIHKKQETDVQTKELSKTIQKKPQPEKSRRNLGKHASGLKDLEGTNSDHPNRLKKNTLSPIPKNSNTASNSKHPDNFNIYFKEIKEDTKEKKPKSAHKKKESKALKSQKRTSHPTYN